MTIQEVIAAADLAQPNELEEELKGFWLAALERQLRQELYDAHEDPPEPGAQELSAPPPYGELYLRYLLMRIALEQGEYARYNNASRLFDAYYRAYAGWYCRTHRPICTADSLKF